MHSSEVVPNVVILFVCHPRAGDEDKEDDIHDLKHDDEAEYLDKEARTIMMETLSFLLTR